MAFATAAAAPRPVARQPIATHRPAGLLSRLGALFIDFLIVVAAVQLAVTAAHYLSRGSYQGAAGLAFVTCDHAREMPVLTPPPPSDYSFALHCQRSLLGLDMANWIVVGKVESRGEAGFDKEHKQFALGPANNQVEGPVTILGDEWIALAFLLYLPLADWLFGSTGGKRMLGLRTVASGSARESASFGRVLLRYLAMHAGLIVPSIILAAYQFITLDFEGSVSVGRGLYLMLAAWILWNCGLLIAGRESLYDRLAGTSVVRRRD